MRWFVRGDIDGFFGLAVDSLVQLILIDSLCRFVLGFPPELLYGRILPGVAVSLLAGNVFYGWQAVVLARKTGQHVCALPYGINTVSLFAYVFLVMLPAKLVAEAAGAADPALVAWQAGLVACLGSGVIELAGALVAERVRRVTPRAALLSTLAGIAVTFIALGFLFRTYAHPIVGLSTLAIVLLVYFGRVRFKGGIPGGLIAVALGVLLSWVTGIAPVGEAPDAGVTLHLPVLALGDLWAGIDAGMLATYMAIIIPMGLFNLIGSLQNIESAEASGDAFPTRPSLVINGIGTVCAAAFGSCFPTTIYIGHPGWKAMGSGAGYSILNGVVFTVVALTGVLTYVVWAVPVDAGMAIVLWIGIVMTAQAFDATPRRHAPAVVVGLMPALAAWGTMIAKTALRVGGYGTPGGPEFSAALLPEFAQSDLWIGGGFALEQGFIFTSMILAAVTVAIIERQFVRGAVWCAVAAALSCTGLMHGYRFIPSDAVLQIAASAPWNNPWAAGYLVTAGVLLAARWATVRTGDDDGAASSGD